MIIVDIKANLFELLKIALLGVVNIVGIYATIYLNKLNTILPFNSVDLHLGK